MMKVRVVKVDGQPIGWGPAAGRVYVQNIASACTCGLAGSLFALSRCSTTARGIAAGPTK